jgi:hypothetical protein
VNSPEFAVNLIEPVVEQINGDIYVHGRVFP